MRLLLLITDLQIGGTPRVVYELATRLRDAHVHTAVACLSPWGPVADELRLAGVPVTAFDATRPTQLLRVADDLADLAQDFDRVLSLLMHANVTAAIASRHARRPRWFQSIQTTQPKPRWHWPLQGLAARAAERVIVPSASVIDVAARRAKIDREKCLVIPNAVDADAFAALPRPPAADVHRVGFVGRLDPVKRIGDLIEAIAILPNTTLDVFGDGVERASLEAQTRHLNLAGRVTFHGRINSAKEALPKIDTLVLPSDAEGFGLVLIEAMAAGVAVIGTNVPGIRDVVRHDQTGLLVPPRSPDAIAAALNRLRDDAALRERLTVAARDEVARRFAWPAVLAMYRRVLDLPSDLRGVGVPPT